MSATETEVIEMLDELSRAFRSAERLEKTIQAYGLAKRPSDADLRLLKAYSDLKRDASCLVVDLSSRNSHISFIYDAILIDGKSISEAARLAGFGRSTLYRWRDDLVAAFIEDESLLSVLQSLLDRKRFIDSSIRRMRTYSY